MTKEKRDRVICFSTTQTMVDQLRALAPSKDSLSALLREIIEDYIASQPNSPAQK